MASFKSSTKDSILFSVSALLRLPQKQYFTTEIFIDWYIVPAALLFRRYITFDRMQNQPRKYHWLYLLTFFTKLQQNFNLNANIAIHKRMLSLYLDSNSSVTLGDLIVGSNRTISVSPLKLSGESFSYFSSNSTRKSVIYKHNYATVFTAVYRII